MGQNNPSDKHEQRLNNNLHDNSKIDTYLENFVRPNVQHTPGRAAEFKKA